MIAEPGRLPADPIPFERIKRGTLSMPDSAVRTFTDPDAYHAALRYAQAQGVVTARGSSTASVRWATIGLWRAIDGVRYRCFTRILLA